MSAERKILHLPPVETPGSEQVTIISESPKSVFLVVRHNSIFGNCPKDPCSGSVAVDIPKNYRGTIKSPCGTCTREVEVSATHILLTIGRPPKKPSPSEQSKTTASEVLEELSGRYKIHEAVLRAWVVAFNNDLTRLEEFLKSQHQPKNK